MSVTPELLFSNGGVSSNPENFTQVGDAVFFTATSTGFGTELWVTDGTASGTTMVADINPGPDSADPFNLVAFDDHLVFAASDGDDNFEPWISDGTESGTHRIKDINPGGSSIEFSKRYLYVPPGFPNPFPYPIELPPLVGPKFSFLDGELFFAAHDGTNGLELWKTDGTESGTQLVADINPGVHGSHPGGNSIQYDYGIRSIFPAEFVQSGGYLFFGALTDNEGFELWRTDGTQEGTQLVRDMYPGNSSVQFYGPYSDIWGLTDVEGTLFYAGYDGEGDYGILKSDGSEEGTVSVTDVNPNDTTYPLRLVALNDELLFFTIDGSSFDDFNFWKSDGTEAGTALIKSFPNSSGDGIPYIRQLAVSEGLLFFAADDGVNGKELWRSDGTEAGTSLVADIQPGAAWSDPHDLTSVNGGIFFSANDGINGTELWVSDSTSVGTYMLADLNSGGNGSDPADLLYVGTKLFFSADDGINGRQPWVIDFAISPTAIAGGPYTVGQGASINLSGEGSLGNISLYEWDFDNDGLYDDATGVNPTFYGATPGVYSVDLRVNGPGGSTTDSTTVTVIPESANIGGPYFGESGTLISLDASGSVGGLFEWDLDDDGLFDDAVGLNADFNATADGIYSISLRVNGPGGPVDSTTVTVEPAIANIGGPYTGSQYIPLPLSAAGSSGTLFEWDLDNDGQFDDATGENVIFDTSIAGVFNVGLRVNGPTGPTASTTVSVSPAIADAGGPYAGFQYGQIPLSAFVDGGVLFEWDLDNDGQFDDAVGSSVNFDASQVGTFNIYLRVNGVDGPIDGTTVHVDPATANIGGPYAGLEGTHIPLTASASSGSLFEWDLDNDGQYDDAVGENISFNAANRGVFPVGLRVNGPNGPTASTTVSVTNAPPTASITGPPVIFYRGETVAFTLDAYDPFGIDQPGLFTFEIDWDGDSVIDETHTNVPSGTTVQRTFDSPTTYAGVIQVRATDSEGATGNFAHTPVFVKPHVLRDDGFGNIDLIWGGTPGLDAVYVLGQAPALSLFVQLESSLPVQRIEHFGSVVTGKVILHGYDFNDVLVGQLAGGNVVEIHGGNGDDVIVGGSLGDFLYGDGGNDTIIGGTQAIDGDDLLFGGEGRDTLFGHIGADTLDGGSGEDLLISDRFSFSNVPAAVQQIANEWKSSRPYSERVSNILGLTSTGVNGLWILDAGSTILDDISEDTIIGGVGELDWFFYDFDQDLLGDTIEVGEEETDSDP